MSEQKRMKVVESRTGDESLAEEVLDQASGGQAGDDLNQWDSQFGNQGTESNQAEDQLKDGDSSASDPEWKYVLEGPEWWGRRVGGATAFLERT